MTISHKFSNNKRKRRKIRRFLRISRYRRSDTKIASSIIATRKSLIIFVTMLLFVAAGLKLWEYATVPTIGTAGWTQDRGVVLCGTSIEILLAFWLLSGWRRRNATTVTVVFFVIVASVAASKWWLGEASCGCFGRLKVPPWITTVLDLAIFLGLILQLFQKKDEPSSTLTTRIIVFLATGIVAAVVMPVVANQYHPTAQSPGLEEENGPMVLVPEKWVGKQFPLTKYIRTQRSITEGACRLVLFHSDCPDCQRLIPQVEEVAKHHAIRTVLVEIPPVAPPRLSIVPAGTVCELGMLDASKEWFAPTPVIIDLLDGWVIRQQAGGHSQP